MTTGEASGIMAALAIKNKVLPKNLNYSDLKSKILFFYILRGLAFVCPLSVFIVFSLG